MKIMIGVATKTARRILACIFLLAAPLLAQHAIAPPASATGPSLEAGVGYVFLSMEMPTQRVSLEGGDINALAKVSTRWGVAVDGVYAHTGNVLGTGYGGNFVSALAGPMFYPVVRNNFGFFVRGMVGASWVDSAVPVSGANYLGGWVARPSFLAGGGFEHSLFGPFSVRISGDYQHTTFVNASDAVQAQNNLRVTTTFSYRFGSAYR